MFENESRMALEELLSKLIEKPIEAAYSEHVIPKLVFIGKQSTSLIGTMDEVNDNIEKIRRMSSDSKDDVVQLLEISKSGSKERRLDHAAIRVQFSALAVVTSDLSNKVIQLAKDQEAMGQDAARANEIGRDQQMQSQVDLGALIQSNQDKSAQELLLAEGRLEKRLNSLEQGVGSLAQTAGEQRIQLQAELSALMQKGQDELGQRQQLNDTRYSELLSSMEKALIKKLWMAAFASGVIFALLSTLLTVVAMKG